MTLSRRLILMVAACITLAVITLSLVFAWLGRTALVEQAQSQAQAVARIVAESARLTEISLDEMQQVVANDLTNLAFVLSRISDTQNQAQGTLLAEVAARGNLPVLWIVDRDLNIIASSIGDYEPLVSGESLPEELSRPALEALAQGSRFSLPLGGSADGTEYVGVRIEGGGAVIASQSLNVLEPVRAANSLPVLLGALLNQDEMQAIMVFDDQQTLMASVGDDIVGAPAERLAMAVLNTTAARLDVSTDRIMVAAPILDTAGIAIGATVISQSRKRLNQMLFDYLVYGFGTVALVLGAGIGAAGVFADRITRPVAEMTRAAREMDRRKFQPSSLDDLARQSDELGILARVFQDMAVEVQAREEHLEAQVKARTAELQQKNLLLEESQRRVEAELDAARLLQAAILPQALPDHPAYSGKATMVPARELGGDFYDFFMINERDLGIVIADVSGKGVPAAFFMAISRTVLQSSARGLKSAGTCLAQANDALCAQNPMDLFVTTFYGILNTETGELTYANGGHNPPMVIRRGDGSVADLPRTGGIALGVIEGAKYAEASIRLSEGDTLFLYTDGISEAMDSAGKEFTDDRLRQALQHSHHNSVDLVLDGVTEAVEAFVGQAEQSDDITCLVVRYNGGRKARPSRQSKPRNSELAESGVAIVRRGENAEKA